MLVSETALTLHVSPECGSVSAWLQRPRDARALYVMAHGAGAGMRHHFMDAIAERLHARAIATLRYQFPYTERGGRRPDPQPRLLQTVATAIEAGAHAMRDVVLLAGGKSMGGRMTSLLAASAPPPALAALAFLGFPLHPPGRDGVQRAAHLPAVAVPMLFVQGTRDKLANMALIERVVGGLSHPATLHVIQGGDHAFTVPKRSGRAPGEVLDEIADAVAQFVARLPR